MRTRIDFTACHTIVKTVGCWWFPDLPNRVAQKEPRMPPRDIVQPNSNRVRRSYLGGMSFFVGHRTAHGSHGAPHPNTSSNTNTNKTHKKPEAGTQYDVFTRSISNRSLRYSIQIFQVNRPQCHGNGRGARGSHLRASNGARCDRE